MSTFKNYFEDALAIVISLLVIVGFVEVVITITLTSLFGLLSYGTIMVISLGLMFHIPWWIDIILMFIGLGWTLAPCRKLYFSCYEISCWLLLRIGNRLNWNNAIWYGAKWASYFSIKA